MPDIGDVAVKGVNALANNCDLSNHAVNDVAKL
jgi:hypothetical protein